MPRVRALARRIRTTLDGVRLHATGSESSETLLHDIAQLASRDGLTVTAIKPTFGSSASPPPFISASSSPLADARYDDFDISVHGAYRDTVGFLRNLSRISTLTRVISLQVERSNESASGDIPALDALIHVQTIRFDPTKPHAPLSHAHLEEHTSCLFPCTALPRFAASHSSHSAS
jgi:Tfp pilus assembly protein PilO